MTRDQLIAVMIYQLNAFNRSGAVVTEDTVHADILSDQGVGTATPQRIYKSFIRATFVMNGLEDPAPRWPSEWTPLTVAELADQLHEEDGDA
jgi:hypothetical protein